MGGESGPFAASERWSMAHLISPEDLQAWLEHWAREYEQPHFIPLDPISIPHRYERPEDIECVAFMTAIIAWGRRSSILQSANRMFAPLGDSPVATLVDASESDLASWHWAHRTLMPEDGLRFMQALQRWYRNHHSMEKGFQRKAGETDYHAAIDRFRIAFAGDWLATRSAKHLASPDQGSAAKRLHLFLRWMVRSAQRGVDFGLWTNTPAAYLSCPLDVHSGQVGRALGLLERKANDQRAVRELDAALRRLDAEDPVRFDFALFGIGESGILKETPLGAKPKPIVPFRG